MIANNTVVSKLLCHDLDEPPDMIHYAPSSGPVGPGQLFKQVPTAENCVQVIPSCCICRDFSQGGGGISWPWLGAGRASKRNSDTAEGLASSAVLLEGLWARPFLFHCQFFCANPCLVGIIVPSPRHHQTLPFSQKIWPRKPLITSLLLWS